MTGASPQSPFSLASRHALIAGGASDLGRTLAVALAEAGARVSLTTTRDAVPEEVLVNSILNECWAMGRDGAVRRLDLTDAAAVEAALSAIEAAAGPIDILVNAAIAPRFGALLEITPEQWRAALEHGVTAAFNTMQAAGGRMVGRGHGRIINLVSALAERGVPHGAAHGATQGAVLALTRAAGLEWGSAGITVNALQVGFIDGVTAPPAGSPQRPAIERYIPLQRIGALPDVMGALVYLASDAAGFHDASALTVDGGVSIRA